MRHHFLSDRMELSSSFDMTPIIDVVFLLIIFFMLVFQFITSEKGEVQVPESIRSADLERKEEVGATVTVGRDSSGEFFITVDGIVAEGTPLG